MVICGGELQVLLWNVFTEGLDLVDNRQERTAPQNECGVLWWGLTVWGW